MLQLDEWVQILATALIIVSVVGICGLYDYKGKVITKQSGLTSGWLVHLAFNLLLLGAARSKCKSYVLPWLVEGMVVTICLGSLSGYFIYSGMTKNQLIFTDNTDLKVIVKYNYLHFRKFYDVLRKG